MGSDLTTVTGEKVLEFIMGSIVKILPYCLMGIKLKRRNQSLGSDSKNIIMPFYV